MIYDVSQLEYCILPGKFPANKKLQDLHNRAFLYWKNFWNNVFKENGTNDTVLADNFMRQDMVTLFLYKNEIVAQHLYSFFNLNSLTAQQHSYFQLYGSEFLEKMKGKKCATFMTMEYVAVSPDWRKKNTGVSLLDVFFGLSRKFQDLHGLDALIGISRSDNGITKVGQAQGAQVVIGDLNFHNTPVDLIAIFPETSKPHHDPLVEKYTKKFWNQRVDHTTVNYIEEKIAAA